MPQLSERLLKRYKETFIPTFSPPFGVQFLSWYGLKRWRRVSRSNLTDAKIRAHLEGRRWIGVCGRAYTREIVIDLDCHNGETDLYDRADRVLGAFPESTLLPFTTPGGGMHVHVLLEQPSWTRPAVAYARDRLGASGIRLKPGYAELYPSGSILRAPLGRDSLLLDTYNWTPVQADRIACLQQLDEMLRNGKVDRLSIPQDYRPDIAPQHGGERTVKLTSGSPIPYMGEIDALLNVGLSAPSTRNSALLKLNWYFGAVCGWCAEDREEALIRWIDTRHNGMSKDYARNPEVVHRQIRHIVLHFDERKIRKHNPGRKRARKPLPEAIQSHIASLPLTDRERCLLGEMMAWGLNRERDAVDGWIEVTIPSRTLKGFDRNYSPVLKSLAVKGYVVKTRNYGVQTGRCNGYRIHAVPH